MRVSASSAAYCERDGRDFDLLGEPANFFSNFFQIAAGLRYTYGVAQQKNLDVNVLGGVLYTAVACGSAIWHSVGLAWTLVLDLAIPFAFIAWFGYNWGYRVLRIRSVWLRFGFLFFALGGTGALVSLYTSPAFSVHWAWFVVLVAAAVWHRLICDWRPNGILASAGLYGVGLACYAMDRVLCEDERKGYQIGSHWLWHVFSALGGLLLLHSLPPEDWNAPGHDVDPWCGCFRRRAVPGEKVAPAVR